MDLSLIVLVLIGWALFVLVVLVFMRMAGDQDREARRAEKVLDPFSEVTITHSGNG